MCLPWCAHRDEPNPTRRHPRAMPVLLRPVRQPQRGLHRRLLGGSRCRAHHLDRGRDGPGAVLLRRRRQPAIPHGAHMTQAEPGASLPRTDRPDAPAYLTRHQSPATAAAQPPAPKGADSNGDGDGPLYLRSFRARQAREAAAPSADEPEWQGESLGVTRAWAEVTRTKEIVPE